MESIYEISDFLKQVMDMLEAQFGSNCEIVLHDHLKPYDQTIVDIRNGHVTDRKIGGCGSNMGLEVLRGTLSDDDRYNYITYTNNGKILRSSSIHFKNPRGKVIGALCINLDITESVRFESFIRDYNSFNPNSNTAPVNEFFAQDVQQLLEELLNQALTISGKTPQTMTREDKLEFVKYLDKRGAFVIAKSSDRVCELLGISRATFYNYLESSRSDEKAITDNIEDD